jgi:hypothetical protein
MLIYEAVEKKLGSEYENVYYQTMSEDKPGDVGIYLYESANDTEDLSGNEVYNCIKIHVQVNSEQSTEGMTKALRYLTKFTERIENENSDVDGIEFMSAMHLGPRAIAIGKNNHNILICRSVIDLKYTFGT